MEQQAVFNHTTLSACALLTLCVFAGGNRDVVQASMSHTPAEGDGGISHPLTASQTGAAGQSYD